MDWVCCIYPENYKNNMLKKSILMTIGILVFVIGMILFPLPVPFGLPIMIVGMAIMFKASDRFKRKVVRWSWNNVYARIVWSKFKDYRKKRKLAVSQSGVS